MKTKNLKKQTAEIHKYYNAVLDNESIGVDYCQRSISFAIRCGEKLREIKPLVGHGQWENWLKAEKISEDKSERYRNLENRFRKSLPLASKTAPVRNLKPELKSFAEQFESLTDAYKGLTIAKKSEKKASPENVAPVSVDVGTGQPTEEALKEIQNKEKFERVTKTADNLVTSLNALDDAGADKAVNLLNPIIEWRNARIEIINKREQAINDGFEEAA